jgi:hypothetical protein
VLKTWTKRSSSCSTWPGLRGGLLIPVRNQPGLKAAGFSPALLVPIAPIWTNGTYKLGLIAFFLLVHDDASCSCWCSSFKFVFVLLAGLCGSASLSSDDVFRSEYNWRLTMAGNHVRVRVRVASRIPGLGPPGRIWITEYRRRWWFPWLDQCSCSCCLVDSAAPCVNELRSLHPRSNNLRSTLVRVRVRSRVGARLRAHALPNPPSHSLTYHIFLSQMLYTASSVLVFGFGFVTP